MNEAAIVWLVLLILLIANVIFVTKPDFFLDDGLGERVNHLDKHGLLSAFGRNHDPYERDSQASFDLGLNSASFNGDRDFTFETRMGDHSSHPKPHRDHDDAAVKPRKKNHDKKLKAKWDAELGRYVRRDEHGNIIPPFTRKPRPRASTTRRPQRQFNIFRRTDEYNRYKNNDEYGLPPNDKSIIKKNPNQ